MRRRPGWSVSAPRRELDWTQAGEGRMASGTVEPHRPPTFSAERPTIPASSAGNSTAPRRHDTSPVLTFSARPPNTEARPVFPQRPPTPSVVRTEVREVRPTVQSASSHWPEAAPTDGASSVAVRRAGEGEPGGTHMAGPIRIDAGAAPGAAPDALQRGTHPRLSPRWSPPRRGSDGRPLATHSSADDWPELPTAAPDALELWHAAQREQERWRELEREQAGERWNG